MASLPACATLGDGPSRARGAHSARGARGSRGGTSAVGRGVSIAADTPGILESVSVSNRILSSLLAILIVPTAALTQDWMKPPANPFTIPLWPDGVPGALGTEDADKPSLTIYLPTPAQATGTGIVVCPGGGYSGLALDHEGHQVARLLTSRGVAAFILKYRLGPRYHHPAMLNDVLQAIRTVRAASAQYSVKPDRLGVMGFSA